MAIRLLSKEAVLASCCPYHGAHEHFCSDGTHVEAFPKLRTDSWKKQTAVLSLLQRLDNVYPGVGTGAIWKFYEKMDEYDNSTRFGFKFSRVHIEYHTVKSTTSSHVRFRCEACERATDAMHFLASAKDAKNFLEVFGKLVAPMIIEDRVDMREFKRSRSKEGPPPPPPLPPDYVCQYEWERHANDAVKQWCFAKTPPPPPKRGSDSDRGSRSGKGSSSSRNSETSQPDSPVDAIKDESTELDCAPFLLEKGDNVQRRKRSLEIVTDLMKRSGGKRQKAADILVEVLWPVRDSDAFSLMDEDV